MAITGGGFSENMLDNQGGYLGSVFLHLDTVSTYELDNMETDLRLPLRRWLAKGLKVTSRYANEIEQDASDSKAVEKEIDAGRPLYMISGISLADLNQVTKAMVEKMATDKVLTLTVPQTEIKVTRITKTDSKQITFAQYIQEVYLSGGSQQ